MPYEYQIKFSFRCPTLGQEPKYWTNWKKYKTMESALQALSDLKKVNARSYFSIYKGKIKHPQFFVFKIYHYYPIEPINAKRQL